MPAKVLNNNKTQRLQVQFCFYRQAVKANTVGWKEQKNHSVYCYAAKSAPHLKRLMAEDPAAYSNLQSLELV